MDKRIIAPIIVGIILTLFYCVLLFDIIFTGVSDIFMVIIVLGLLGIIGTVIYSVKQRIDEIKSGEEDDISQYWLYLSK